MGDPEKITVAVSACCALHNYLLYSQDKDYLPPGAVDAMDGAGEVRAGNFRAADGQWAQAPHTQARNSTVVAARIRQDFTDYFSNEGQVPWQLEHINRR